MSKTVSDHISEFLRRDVLLSENDVKALRCQFQEALDQQPPQMRVTCTVFGCQAQCQPRRLVDAEFAGWTDISPALTDNHCTHAGLCPRHKPPPPEEPDRVTYRPSDGQVQIHVDGKSMELPGCSIREAQAIERLCKECQEDGREAGLREALAACDPPEDDDLRSTYGRTSAGTREGIRTRIEALQTKPKAD